MPHARVQRLAEVLIDYSLALKPGDVVAVRGNTIAEPLLKAIFVKALKAGAHPFMLVSLQGQDELLMRYGSDEQLRHVPEPAKLIAETYDASITVLSDENTRALSSVDPSKMVLIKQAQSEMMQTFLRRVSTGEMRWVGTLFPTNGYAQDCEMGLSEYEDFVYSACLPDAGDPVGYWRRFSAGQQKIVDWFKGKRNLRVIGPETDLRMSIEGRRFINCDGHENMPDGEIFTGPVEDSVEGRVRFAYPAIYNGREVSGVRLWFERGKVVKASAEKNEDFLLRMLDTDDGARYVGEFAIGTNRGISRFTRHALFDEKISGTFHMALGAGLAESGAKNKSAIHWDMICDLREGGEIRVDNELLHKDGKFVIEF
jgi:aminopeptidase